MRKSLIISTIFIILSFTVTNIHAFRNETKGYNGYKWGMELEDFLQHEKRMLKKKNGVFFGDRIKGIDVDVGYEFFEDKLYGVKINFPEKKKATIVEYFTMLHGRPTLKRGKDIFWVGSDTKITIKRKDVNIVSKKLERKYLKAARRARKK